MRAIPLRFDENGSRFDMTLKVLRDFQATAQNALINVATKRGSDPWYSDRGTYLQVDGARGQMVSELRAAHASNFAALDTVIFSRATEMPDQTDHLQKLRLEVVGIKKQQLGLAFQAISSRGEVVGRIFEV